VNKDEYLIYYAYTPVQSAITFDSLGRCFRFVYIILYACTFFLCCYCFSVNKDLYNTCIFEATALQWTQYVAVGMLPDDVWFGKQSTRSVICISASVHSRPHRLHETTCTLKLATFVLASSHEADYKQNFHRRHSLQVMRFSSLPAKRSWTWAYLLPLIRTRIYLF